MSRGYIESSHTVYTVGGLSSATESEPVVTGSVNLMAPDDWSPFEAAHIFPLEKESLWIAGEFQRWISDMEDK